MAINRYAAIAEAARLLEEVAPETFAVKYARELERDTLRLLEREHAQRDAERAAPVVTFEHETHPEVLRCCAACGQWGVDVSYQEDPYAAEIEGDTNLYPLHDACADLLGRDI